MKILTQWLKANSVILANAGSLIATNVMTSGLGFAFWWIAARQFQPEAVGIASASVSAMNLLGSFCVLGLGTLLITELPRQPGHEGELISTALLVVGGVSLCVGGVFALASSYVSPGFQPLNASIPHILTFAIGVALTSTTTVLDQALIGLLYGNLQLWRNTIFAATKFAILFIVGIFFAGKGGITIYAIWALGNIISLLALALFFVFKKRGLGKKYFPQWGLLRNLGGSAVQHHLLNLTLQLPTSVLPVLVTALFSARVNAWFYVAWMIVSFAFYVPVALTTVLHAVNSAQRSTLARKARMTISLAAGVNAAVALFLLVGAREVLSIFGSTYAEQSTTIMHILMLAAFALVIRDHFISISRIFDRLKGAMKLIVPGCILELGTAAVAGHFGGVTGLCIGWVAALYIEALTMLPTVYKTVWGKQPEAALAEESLINIALIETTPLPSIGQNFIGTQEAIWLMETFHLPAVRKTTEELASIRTSGGLTGKGITQELVRVKIAQDQAVRKTGSRVRLKPPALQPYTLPTPQSDRVLTTEFTTRSDRDGR